VGDDAVEECGLDLKILGDGLDDPVARGHAGQIIVKGAGRDEGGAGLFKEGCRLGFGEGVETSLGQGWLARILCGQVKQQGGNAGVGKVSGDARAHGSGAEDGNAADQHGLGGGANCEIGNGCGGAHANLPARRW